MHLIDSIIRLIEVVIWPLTLLIILGWFKNELKGFFGSLKKIQASGDGIVFESFERQLKKTREIFNQLGAAKSAPGIGLEEKRRFIRDKSIDTRQQIVEWDDQFRSQILTASGDSLLNAEEGLEQLKSQGLIPFAKYQLSDQLLKMGKLPPENVSESLLNELQEYYNRAAIN